MEDFEDIKSGFRIVLRFAASNPFFSDAALTKEFHYGDDGKVAIHPATINWTEGHVSARAEWLGGHARTALGRSCGTAAP